jgi:addiction module HigA family antidote
MATKRRPTAPGVILKSHFLDARGLSISRFAALAGISRKHVSAIIHARASITADTAWRFAQVLDTSAAFWMNLQVAVDLFDARARLDHWRPRETHPGTAAPPI